MSDEVWVADLEDLQEFISFVILYAPDDFPEEDFLSSEEQLDLEKAFAELRKGLVLLKRKISDPAEYRSLEEILNQSHVAYRQGDDVKGAHLLQAFEEQAFSR